MRQFIPRGARAAFAVALAACSSGGGGAGSGGPTAAADTQAADAGQETATVADTSATVDGSTAGAETAAETAGAADTAEVAAVDVAKPKPATTGTQKEPGNFAPDFTKVVASTGQPVSKADLLGHWTVLWFYPAAQTSG